MGPRIWISMVSRAAGFAVGWAAFALALTLASRLMGWGPGFSNPLPYATLAICLCGAGQLARRWQGERAAPADSAATTGVGQMRLAGREFRRGASLFMRGTAAFNNFLLLSITYILGIGLSSLFVRNQSGAKTRKETGVETYWQDLNLGKKDADAYYRPF